MSVVSRANVPAGEWLVYESGLKESSDKNVQATCGAGNKQCQ